MTLVKSTPHYEDRFILNKTFITGLVEQQNGVKQYCDEQYLMTNQTLYSLEEFTPTSNKLRHLIHTHLCVSLAIIQNECHPKSENFQILQIQSYELSLVASCAYSITDAASGILI